MPLFNAQLSPEVLRKRNTVGINSETVTNVTSTDVPGHYPGEDHSWSLESFRNNLHIEFHKNEPHDAVFSLIGIDASIANAFRRILLAEIPTLAIEDVFVNQNTSIIQDEVLSHRLGLVPLKGSKEGLRWLKWRKRPTEEGPLGDPSTDFNTVVLELKVECTWQEEGKERAKLGETDPKKLYNNAHVYASSLNFKPIGQQATLYFTPELGIIAPVNPGILLAKLRPGQSLDMTMHAIQGIGSDHAKFSPVSTASYRLMPTIDILAPIVGADATKFKKCFSRGVIGLETLTDEEVKAGLGKAGDSKAVVREPERDTVSRECLRHEQFKGKVKLGRRRDHFIFSVESTGQVDSDELFVESVKLLRKKCVDMKRMLLELKGYA